MFRRLMVSSFSSKVMCSHTSRSVNLISNFPFLVLLRTYPTSAFVDAMCCVDSGTESVYIIAAKFQLDARNSLKWNRANHFKQGSLSGANGSTRMRRSFLSEARRAQPISNNHSGTPFSPECVDSHGNSVPHVTTRGETPSVDPRCICVLEKILLMSNYIRNTKIAAKITT